MEDKKSAFRHIFCGEIDNDKLGGMHFVGRYVEVQKERMGRNSLG
ncbi:EndoU domain-containing protein [Wolbachia endosymbiont of Pentidionis agamae]